jgi:RNA polymerase sigma factor (sigma-70 family)
MFAVAVIDTFGWRCKAAKPTSPVEGNMNDIIYLTPGLNIARLFEAVHYRWNRIFFLAVRQHVPHFDSDLAEDICQQVWTEVWQGIVQGRYKYLSMGLLLIKADSRIVDHWRWAKRHRQFDPIKHDRAHHRDMNQTLSYKQALAAIPEDQRTVVTLRFRHGYTQNEVAERLNITDRTVRRRLTAAEKNMREFLCGGS